MCPVTTMKSARFSAEPEPIEGKGHVGGEPHGDKLRLQEVGVGKAKSTQRHSPREQAMTEQD